MSLVPQRQKEHQVLLQQSQLAQNFRKKSDSTLQVAERVRQNLIGHHPHEYYQPQDQFQDEVYKDLSSGVYQMSRKSEREEQQPDQKEYYSQQIRIGYELPAKNQQHDYKQQKNVEADCVGERYKQLEMHVEQYMQKVLSPKLQSQEVPHFNQQAQFCYPSMMDQSNQENAWGLEQQSSRQAQKQHKQVIKGSCSKEQALYNQSMNIQVNFRLESMLKNQRQTQKISETVDLLNIQSEQKPKSLAGKLNANRFQQQINDEQSLQQKQNLQGLEQNFKLRILGYQKQYFLKIETQVYQIQFCSSNKNYTFNRKFADFILLDKLLKWKYAGYILYPFPSNNLEFFNKIKLSVGTELEKAILIEKRLLELQKYLNFLLNHNQLGASQVFETFIAESDEQFTRHIAYLQKQIEKEEQKFGSSKIKQNYKSIKNFVMSSFTYFASYVSSNRKNLQNIALLAQLRRKSETLKQNFDNVYVELDKNKLVTSNIQIKAEKLSQIYESNIQMKPIESSIDSVLRLSSKMASSKTAYQLHKNWVQDKMLQRIYYFVRIFAQVQQQVEYRRSLLEKIDLLEQRQVNLGANIIQRIQSFDIRFIKDWEELKLKFENQYFGIIDQFSKQWQFHCIQMSKIWK